MSSPRTTVRLTLAILGTVALLGAAAAAGVDRSTEMMKTGISTGHTPTGNAIRGAGRPN